MEIFLDTADVNQIRQAVDMGLIEGVTTNPSLIAATGRKFEEVIAEICTIIQGPISAETVSMESGPMFEEAKRLAKINENVVVKIPLIAEGLKTVKRCAKEGIKTNVTLCFSVSQALLAAKAGATYISPFIGRLDDISQDGMTLIQQIRQVYDNYGFATKILGASLRHPIHVVECALAGVDVVTLPFDVLKKLIHHPLTASGLEKFLEDWKKVPKA